MTCLSKNWYIDKLDDIINKCNNTCHSTIKMKLVDVKPTQYIDTSEKNNDKDPKSKISNVVRKSQYKNVFVKVYTPN